MSTHEQIDAWPWTLIAPNQNVVAHVGPRSQVLRDRTNVATSASNATRTYVGNDVASPHRP